MRSAQAVALAQAMVLSQATGLAPAEVADGVGAMRTMGLCRPRDRPRSAGRHEPMLSLARPSLVPIGAQSAVALTLSEVKSTGHVVW